MGGKAWLPSVATDSVSTPLKSNWEESDDTSFENEENMSVCVYGAHVWMCVHVWVCITQQTTRPFIQGSLASSSLISSLTTLFKHTSSSSSDCQRWTIIYPPHTPTHTIESAKNKKLNKSAWADISRQHSLVDLLEDNGDCARNHSLLPT